VRNKADDILKECNYTRCDTAITSAGSVGSSNFNYLHQCWLYPD